MPEYKRKLGRCKHRLEDECVQTGQKNIIYVCLRWIILPENGDKGRALWTRKWPNGLHKMHGIYRITQDSLASQEGLCPLELEMLQEITIN
jgi:hypothetical protein